MNGQNVALTPTDDKYSYLEKKSEWVYRASPTTRKLTGSSTLLSSEIGNLLRSVHTYRAYQWIRTSFSDESSYVRYWKTSECKYTVAALDPSDLSTLARTADVIMAAKRVPTFMNASTQPSKKLSLYATLA